ncbi:MAG TPA: 2-isopropylmalate synthase [Chitinispirillaceae bacterium]|nr:2-isopropylmalate synthase [Chitinispirillaceae bacterium]
MTKYVSFPEIHSENRSWPDRQITKAPRWCSVDLRDGNQALVNPMQPGSKLEMFRMLTRIGFREIEVSFPASSRQEYEFTRTLIEQGHIPDDVTIQVLTQSREDLIKKTFDALRGVKKAIVHIYNSTSPAQREMVFGKSTDEIIRIAVDGIRYARELADKSNSDITLEYSPESFSQTELPFAAEICHAVIDAWKPSGSESVIINLPATVEAASPHVYADQIECMARAFNSYKNVIISVHTHNDRGCAVAAAELAQCAGATRVEGTLFGNGERTGNADIITLALNLYTQGIDPYLDFSNLPDIAQVYSRCTTMAVPPRHPYAGELVFTAFSGSHQDAISKSMKHFRKNGGIWNIPYIPIDPEDIGRDYESVIRINSQSGKGGAAYILEKYHGFSPPREMVREFGEYVKDATAYSNDELTINEIGTIFKKIFFDVSGPFSCDIVTNNNIANNKNADHRSITIRFKTPSGDFYVPESIEVTEIGTHVVSHLNNVSIRDIPVTMTMISIDPASNGITTVYTQIQYGSIQKSGASTHHNPVVAAVRALSSALNRCDTIICSKKDVVIQTEVP